jgi:2-keto-3-deoxy-L-rhamnonate aldolase RhmA
MGERNYALKAALKGKQTTIGSWISLGHPAIAEIMVGAGFEWLVVDLEHSAITLGEAAELIRVIDLCGVTPLVRVSANDPVQIKRVMDAGAHGVIVPMVNSASEAEQAVAAVRYPPQGRRGVGLARAQGYGTTFENYWEWVQKESIVIVQVEHILAVNNLAAILAVPGVDGLIVGPYDLSCSLGLPGEFDHPRLMEALEEIRQVAAKSTASAGYHVVPPQPDQVRQKLTEGYSCIAYSVDFLLLGEMCRQGLNTIREALSVPNRAQGMKG